MRSTAVFAAVALCLCTALPAAGQEPGAGPVPAAAITPSAGESLGAALYRDLAESLERERGPWDPELGETLLSLGLVLQNENQHAEAIDVLSQALHIHRVNEGLQAMSQIPILESIIRSNVATENWEDLDVNYQRLLWTYNRNFEPSDEALLPIVERVGSWKVRAYTEGLLEQGGYTTISEADELYSDTVRIASERYGELDPRLIGPLYGVAMTQYQLLVEEINRPIKDYHRGGTGTRNVMQCRAVPPDGHVICTLVQVIDTDHYRSIENEREFQLARLIRKAGEALEHVTRIFDAHPDLSADAHAAALVHLGDWNMIMRRSNTATEHYRKAINVLADAGTEPAAIDEIFGTPRQLPTLHLPLPEVDEHEAAKEHPFVRLTMDVSRRGRPRNVTVVDASDPENNAARRRAKQDIRSRIFRPRFVNGEPVDTEGYTMKWLVK